ncbi:type III secretion system chaperone [Parachitinimonas caeni]|uniref:Type III secretion system chaperone n=1 Tax=Parachitinimonas caeni TaxID=3031301 RepID=A0ABT7E1C1_9NEIS|nr:type III secretion system chaperone [Parachitinimonas caeni]MDK2126086.1 type III secretion system chaperone [Parachitinimonas caeni]
MTTFHDLLAGAAGELGINPETLQGVDAIQINFGDNRIVTIEKLDGREMVGISALLCFMPDSSKLSALSQLLLEAHTFGYLTNDVVFGLDRNAGKVLMFKNLPLSVINSETLLAELSVFKETYQTWKAAYDSGRLLDATSDGATVTAAPQDPASFAFA